MSDSLSAEASMVAAGQGTQRWLVENARRNVPVARFLAIPFFGAVYAGFAAFHPVFGVSPESILILSMLAMLTLGYAIMSPNADILDPMRVVSIYFLIIFCLAPLAMRGVDWHYTRPYTEILPGAVRYCAFAYILVLVGYHLPIFARTPTSIAARHEPYNSSLASILALMIFAVGFASWVVLFGMAGGIEGLVNSTRARGEFFEGFGYFFWAAIFMFPGATLYWCARCVGKEKAPWIHFIPLLVAFFAFLILQGRMRALNFLILGLFVSHYMIKPVKPTRLLVFGVAALLLALFIGFARAPSTRADAFLDPVGTVVAMADNFSTVGRGFITADLARLNQIVLIMDKVPSWMSHDWGGSIFIFLNPWFRLFGFGNLQMEAIDVRLFRLAHPEAGPLPTGILPSFLGEMLVNFPWPIAIFFFIPYGMALRWAYSRLIINRGDFVAVTFYAVLLLQAANIILQSFSHVIFEMMIVLIPLGIAQFISRRPASRSHRSAEGANAPPASFGDV